MLRIIVNTSPAGARSYYSTADYYAQELPGQWRGKGATRLGLSGEIAKEHWDALCDNKHPTSGDGSEGKPLTPRQKNIRRVGYDFNFHVPKSVSVLYAMTRDERIMEAFRESVNRTMEDMEAEMKTRVRIGGVEKDRQTGEMVWGEHVHTTARPMDGIPDPHLHAHCFVFNSTWDPVESRWKAGQFADIKRDASYFEAVFHSRMAERMADLGLEIERTKKGWELSGLSAGTLKKFSRRTTLIEELAREQGIADDRSKSELGAKTREHKRKDLSNIELREIWQSWMTKDERAAVGTMAKQIGGKAIVRDEKVAVEATTLAFTHCFERKSVVSERELQAQAIKRAVGKASAEAVKQAVAQRDVLIVERDGRRMATTQGGAG